MAVLAAGTVAVAGAVTYGLARPYFKYTVNCHFCDANSKVSFEQRNSWTCSRCDQYNGFKEDGDYNKPVHHIQSISQTFAKNMKERKVAENGFCKTCNLNQELKISQLASFPGEGSELEDYRLHLERVYRLCAGCEEVLASKLLDQDNKLAPGIIEHKLETSRLSAQYSESTRISPIFNYLCDSQVLFSMLLFFVLLNPALSREYSNFLPLQLQHSLRAISSSIQSNSYSIHSFLVYILALTSLILLRFKIVSVVGFLPMLCLLLNLSHVIQLSVACLCGFLIAVVPVKQPKSRKPVSRRPILDTMSCRFIETESVTDSGEGGSNTSISENIPKTKLLSPSPSFLFQTASNLLSPSRMSSPLLRSGDTNSLNHEFVTENVKDYDISSLTLGEEEAVRPTSVSSCHFSPRLYTPENTSGIRFAPSRPVLRPSRLTSWVAGGYWTPPTTQVFGEPISRSSSQSSGFVSASVAPSVHNFSLLPPPQNYVSLPNSPVQSIYGDCDRFSVFSEPMRRVEPTNMTQLRPEKFISRRRSTLDDDLSDGSVDRSSQVRFNSSKPVAQSSPILQDKVLSSTLDKEKSLLDQWSLTITITPWGILLGASLAANLAVLYIYVLT